MVYQNFRSKQFAWSQIQIPLEVNENPYTEVLGRLEQYPQNDGDIDIVLHSTYRIKFRNRIANFQERFGTIPSSESVSDETQSVNKECSEESAVNYATSSMIGNVKTLEKRCFICNEIRIVDNNPYNEGGLQRCSRGPTAEKTASKERGVFAGRSIQIL